MDMDHLIGQRFNLISKSEIRYIGTLHEINPEQSTIALENVYSFGTEDRKVEKFIPPSQQKYGFIVFRGNDVKDIKIAEDEQPQPSPPPNMPNDPAILNASQPGPAPGGPPRDNHFSPPGYPPHPAFGGYYPPGQFGRGYGPPPGGFGPGPGFSPYGPPPPGYFGPPGGQGFPQGPGPQHFQPPPPIGPPGQRNIPQPQLPPQSTPDSHPSAPAAPSNQTSELPVDNKAPQAAFPTVGKDAQASGPPQLKPTLAEVAARAQKQPSAGQAPSAKIAAPGPSRTNKVAPAIPFTVNQKSFTPVAAPAADGPPTNGAPTKPSKPVSSQAAMDEAARQAKEAVAAAMAKLNPQAATSQQAAPAAAVDALTKKVAEMSTSNAPTAPARGGRGGPRGGRGGNYGRGGSRKIEIPQSDFDFESANAKFSKEDLIKEAIATGSPPVAGSEDNIHTDGADTDAAASSTPQRKDSVSTATTYNRSTSFFDNISSEAKDREEGSGGNGRQVRSEEFKKNVETFGQGNVDGGYRGRGRGGYGRGRQYGGTYRGGYGNRGGYGSRGQRGRGGQGQMQGQAQAPASQTPTQS
ncbi:G2/M phase checkpoint control protein Sum2 [Exophiala viscosa]|uniref:G2/M phase checkpoint control protein Sum2 n=1 Tax=Exophiala viscosa TaxID=2486360 RepID=UPI002194D89A|nr:G2/M phase checkpoint control protein Sum2 [Exophiala viscosa]